MKTLDKKTQYNLQYAKEKLKRIPLDVPKEYYDLIREHAEIQGESVNGFLKRAIAETMDRDNSQPYITNPVLKGGETDG